MNHSGKNQATQGEQVLPSLQGYEYGTPEYAERTKPWAQCTVEQKLDRIRDELLGVRQMSRWHQERFGRLDEQLHRLEHHQHGHDGTVMIRTRDVERGYGVAGQLADRVFDPLA